MQGLECLIIASRFGLEELSTQGEEHLFLCPNHDDHEPSLKINSQKNVFLCGPCGASGSWWKLVAFLGHVDPADKQAVKQLLSDHGLIDDRPPWRRILMETVVPTHETAEPLRLYFRNRGLNADQIPPDVRYHPNLPYYENGEIVARFPAVVATFYRDGEQPVGILRIYITEDGQKAPVSTPKKMLGRIKGAAIPLSHARDKVLHLAEGLETGLAIFQVTDQLTWVAGSAMNLRAVRLSKTLEEVHIWADLDDDQEGERAAEDLARGYR